MLGLPVWLQVIEGDLKVLKDRLPLPASLPDVLMGWGIVQVVIEAQELFLVVLRIIIKLWELIS